MYGRADGMPSFQLTMAVRAINAVVGQYILRYVTVQVYRHKAICDCQSGYRDMRVLHHISGPRNIPLLQAELITTSSGNWQVVR
jgi:hypothetical protein